LPRKNLLEERVFACLAATVRRVRSQALGRGQDCNNAARIQCSNQRCPCRWDTACIVSPCAVETVAAPVPAVRDAFDQRKRHRTSPIRRRIRNCKVRPLGSALRRIDRIAPSGFVRSPIIPLGINGWSALKQAYPVRRVSASIGRTSRHGLFQVVQRSRLRRGRSALACTCG
jgi:hypothetical protein